MKTKLYRTITLVLAVIMLLGVTPAFATESSFNRTTSLTAEDYDNHNYTSLPYDYNVAADKNSYVPFSACWDYGDRTSAYSKGLWWELKDGVCYVDANADKEYSKAASKGIDPNFTDNLPANTLTGFFEGNTHLKTIITKNVFPVAWYNAPEVKLAISLCGQGLWCDWTRDITPKGCIRPTFPRNVTIITGLVEGTMTITNSTDRRTQIKFSSRADFIEAVRPILASAHLTDEAWAMIPEEFGGKAASNTLSKHIVSDWAKDEVTKALLIGIINNDGDTIDETKNADKLCAATCITNTYEAICKVKGINPYPSAIPETFGPNFGRTGKDARAENKAAYLGICKGDGTTRVYDGKTYSNFASCPHLTREQMAAMLVRLAKACGKTLPAGTMPFTDAMSDWAKPEVSACYGAGLIKGTSATTFGALDNITREQVIVLCYRAYVYLTANA